MTRKERWDRLAYSDDYWSEGRNKSNNDREIAFGLALMAKQHLNKNKMKKLRIKIHSEAHNRAVQERLFEMGYEWSVDKKNTFSYPKAKQLFGWPDGNIEYSNSAEYNTSEGFLIYTLDELYSIEIESKKEELEAGNWYRSKAPESKFMFYLNGINNNYYGWGSLGIWSDNLLRNVSRDSINTDEYRKVTDSEVLDRFRKEFKDRGFTEGCSWNSMRNSETMDGYSEENMYFENGDKSTVESMGAYVFRNGTFATPIVDTLPKIAGYRGEFTDTGVKYGCTEVDFDFILKDSFDSITKMEFDGGNIVYYEDLKEVKKTVRKHLDGKKGNTAVGKWVCVDPSLIKSIT